jgi:putative PIN family toxin of toxin-antitoxin system
MGMINIVLDTNCLIATVPKGLAQHWFWKAFRKRLFNICATTDIIEEYDEILSRRYSSLHAKRIIFEILDAPNFREINVSYNWFLITVDPDDNKFVDCAVAANADAIVTYDRHFDVLKKVEFPAVNVLKLEAFHDLLKTLHGGKVGCDRRQVRMKTFGGRNARFARMTG